MYQGIQLADILFLLSQIINEKILLNIFMLKFAIKKFVKVFIFITNSNLFFN